MNPLLKVTALIEVSTGLGLIVVACWLVSYDDQGCAARGVVSAMVIYNLGVALVLGIVGFQSRPVGILLWPAVILHTAMATWCITNLLRKPVPLTPPLGS